GQDPQKFEAQVENVIKALSRRRRRPRETTPAEAVVRLPATLTRQFRTLRISKSSRRTCPVTDCSASLVGATTRESRRAGRNNKARRFTGAPNTRRFCACWGG